MKTVHFITGLSKLEIPGKGINIKFLPAVSCVSIIKIIMITGLFALFLVYFVPWLAGNSFLLYSAGSTKFRKNSSPTGANLNKEVKSLAARLDAYTPTSTYLIINTNENKYQLYKGKELLREGLCSSGSYIKLEQDHNNKWKFKTPRGIFRIHSKTRNPVWKKPDWAFIEEGLPVPPPNHPSRFEYGVLGDYALSIGNGYLIHGTLYQRLLGMPVTHGCIRLADEDLELVYQSLNIGSKVYIY